MVEEDKGSGSKLMRVQRDLGLAINLEEDFNEILKMCLTAALEVSGMDCGGIYIVTQEGGLEMKAHFGLSPAFVEKTTYYHPESASTILVKSGQALYTRYKDLKVPKDDVRDNEGLEAIAVIPIPSKAGIIGGLNVASHTLENVPQKAKTALEVIANQIGGAIRRWKIDIEKAELQRRYLEVQKMEAVGQLAAGIAHDFNNMLMGFMNCAEMISVSVRGETREYADEIIKLAKRGADLTRQILASARKGIGEQVVIDIEDQIRDAVTFLSKTRMPKTIGIKREFNAPYCKIKGDPGLIQLAILNLGINALHAMEEEGGDLIIRTEEKSYLELMQDDSMPKNCVEMLKPRNYLEISVIDTGIGMDEATMTHCFDLGFTTKEPGKGTGLGLAAAYGTITSHNGCIKVESKLGKGSAFRIYLPLIPESEIEQEKRGKPSTEFLRGSGAILIADDEEGIRENIKTYFTSLGYQVYAASSARGVLEAYNNYRIDLAILDIHLEDAEGMATIDEVRRINPKAKIMMLTGFVPDAKIYDQGIPVMVKPVSLRELAVKAANMIKGRR